MRVLTKSLRILPNIISFAFFFFLFLAFATPQLSESFAQSPSRGSIPKVPIALEGEFIVSFNDINTLKNMGKSENPNWLKALGVEAEVDTTLAAFNIAHVKLANPASSGQWDNLARELKAHPAVQTVEPNYIVHSFGRPNDPMLSKMWFLDKIDAFKAWDTPQGNEEDIIVAVVDDGVFTEHEDLEGKIWFNPKEIHGNHIDDDQNGFVDDHMGWNFYNKTNSPRPNLNPLPTINKDGFCVPANTGKAAYSSHGTHVAGTIAALGNNQKGIVGIAPNVKIMAIKVMGGSCGFGNSFDVLQGVFYAYRNGAKIINLSLGSYGKSRLAEGIYKYLNEKGVLIVAAAGNEANDNDAENRTYPSSYPFDNILSVAATGADDKLAPFSNYGIHNVDLAAPGIDIVSTIPSGQDYSPENGYDFYSGTSMASPVVSGAAAMLMTRMPGAGPGEIIARLMNSADRLGSLSGKIKSGARLNLNKALRQENVSPSPAPGPVLSKPRPRQDESYGGIRVFDVRQNH